MINHQCDMANNKRKATNNSLSRDGKRQRVHSPRDRLSSLSDELLVRILHFLPLARLLQCERLSQRFRRLSLDSQLWKSLYYVRFVLPRSLRVPGNRTATSSLTESARVASQKYGQWLVHEAAQLGGEHETGQVRSSVKNWKSRYRLRHNWTRGACQVGELAVGGSADHCQPASVLVGLAGGIVVTVNRKDGLRAWDLKAKNVLAVRALDDAQVPTCLDVAETSTNSTTVGFAIGFIDGSWSIWEYDGSENIFTLVHREKAASLRRQSLSAIAYAERFVLTITHEQIMCLYSMQDTEHKEIKVLCSLRSCTTWPPLSLSLRRMNDTLVASVAYTLPTYISGFTIGIQELRFAVRDNENPPTLIASRLTTAQSQGFHLDPRCSGTTTPDDATLVDQPSSITYAHPYILVTNPDNTLTLHLCTSTTEQLSITPGTRLWGHTSGVSSAKITSRGKAVSVSARGDELRVWELEGGTLSLARRKSQDASVVVKGVGNPCITADAALDSPSTLSKRRWLGFDEEMVLVLNEDNDAHALEIYDFT